MNAVCVQVLYAVVSEVHCRGTQDTTLMSSRAFSQTPIADGGTVSWRSVLPWPALVIAAVAAAALLPLLFLGLPSGHDFEFHLNSWLEVAQQWKQGIVYPRWASGAHYGYGEARFVFYPPASWLLGALLGVLLPWPLVPVAYVLIALVAAGISMFYLASRFLSRPDAIFVSALYAVNPYHLVIVYWRSAFAELLASCLLPLLLLFLLRSEEDRNTLVPLSLVVAAGWLANAPAAVMINYSLALLAVVLAIVRRSPRILVTASAAVALGAALAAFYVFPAAYEEKWVNIGEVLAPGVRPQDNFLFTNNPDADHNRFNLLVSLVAVTEVGVSLLLAFAARRWRKLNRSSWWTLLAWTAASTLLMISPTFFFWEHLPKLRFVQLPWRWLLCLNVGLALLTCIGTRRWMYRAAICVLMTAVLASVWFKVQPPWWDSAADVVEMHDNVEEGRGYEGTDEYVPTGADAYEVKPDAPAASVPGGGNVRVRVEWWQAESKQLLVHVTTPANLVLHLFNYPAWRAEVNGHPVKTLSQEATGQMLIPVLPGENRVQVAFTRTWDRTLGAVVSVIALALIILLAIYCERMEPA